MSSVISSSQVAARIAHLESLISAHADSMQARVDQWIANGKRGCERGSILLACVLQSKRMRQIRAMIESLKARARAIAAKVRIQPLPFKAQWQAHKAAKAQAKARKAAKAATTPKIGAAPSAKLMQLLQHAQYIPAAC